MGQGEGRREAWLTGLALLVAGVYAAAVVVPSAERHAGTFASYYTAARILVYEPQALAQAYDDAWFGEQVVRAGFVGIREVFVYNPPTMSLMLVPLASLPPRAARLLWVPLSLGSLLGGLVLLARALGAPLRWGLWALPLALLYAPVQEDLRLGQAYLVLFGLLCVFFWGEASGRRPAAGAALGLMLILKTAAVWLWPLMLLTGRWRTLLWAAGAALAVALASLPWIGLAPWRIYLFDQLPSVASRPERYVTAYQTVTSLFGHLFTEAPPYSPTPLIHVPGLAWLATLAVAAISLVLSVRWARRTRQPAGGPVLTLAMFLALAVPNAPLGEGYHYVLILPAFGAALVWAVRSRPGWRAWAGLITALALVGAPIPYRWPQFEPGAWALLAYPRVYGAFILWGWLGWAINRPAAARPEAR